MRNKRIGGYLNFVLLFGSICSMPYYVTYSHGQDNNILRSNTKLTGDYDKLNSNVSDDTNYESSTYPSDVFDTTAYSDGFISGTEIGTYYNYDIIHGVTYLKLCFFGMEYVYGKNVKLKKDIKADRDYKYKHQANYIYKLDPWEKSLQISGILDLSDYGCTDKNYLDSGLLYGCDGLTELKLNDKITTLSSSLFQGLSNLSSITGWNLHDFTEIPSSVFQGCSALPSISFLSSLNIETIDNHAFDGCSSISDFAPLYNPQTIETVGDYSFAGCTKLSEFKLPSTVSSIGVGAFSKCTSISSFILPTAYSSISGHLFEGCTNLSDIQISSSLTDIGEYAFANTGFYDLDLSNKSNLKTIGPYAFASCTHLSSILLPSSITEIDNNAFNGCVNLTSVNFSNLTNLTTIGDAAFYGCNGLNNVDLSKSTNLTTIGANAFSKCENLNSFYLSPNIDTIGANAFTDSKIINLFFENPTLLPKNVNQSAFSNCGVQNIYVNNTIFDNTSNPPESIFKNWGLSSTYIWTNEAYTNWISGTECAGDISIAKEFTYGKYAIFSATNFVGTDISFSDSISTIKEDAFRGNSNIKGDLTIGTNIKSIQKNAFYGCSEIENVYLESLTVPKFADDCFSNCPNTNFIIKNSPSNINDYVKAIMNWTGQSQPRIYVEAPSQYFINGSVSGTIYAKCDYSTTSNVTYEIMSATNLVASNISFNENVKQIGANAFSNSDLSGYVVIDDNIHEIGENAFSNNNFSWVFIDWTDGYVAGTTNLGANCFAYGGSDQINFCVYESTQDSYSSDLLKSIGLDPDTSTFGGLHDFTKDSSVLFSTLVTNGLFIYDVDQNDQLKIVKVANISATNLAIRDTVSEIETDAFTGSSNLSGSISLSATTYVNTNAFDQCTNINTLYIKGAPEMYDQNAFSGLTNLKYVFYASEIWPSDPEQFDIQMQRIGINSDIVDYGIDDEPATNVFSSGLSDSTNVLSVVIHHNEEATQYTIVNADKIKGNDLVLNSNVININDYAFVGNQNISGSFTLTDKITTIGKDIFMGCYNISCIYLNWTEDEIVNQNKLDINANWLKSVKYNDDFCVIVPTGMIEIYQENASSLGLNDVTIKEIIPPPTHNTIQWWYFLIVGIVVLAISVSIGLTVGIKKHRKQKKSKASIFDEDISPQNIQNTAANSPSSNEKPLSLVDQYLQKELLKQQKKLDTQKLEISKLTKQQSDKETNATDIEKILKKEYFDLSKKNKTLLKKNDTDVDDQLRKEYYRTSKDTQKHQNDIKNKSEDSNEAKKVN